MNTEELYGENPELTSFKEFVDEIVEGKGVLLQADYIRGPRTDDGSSEMRVLKQSRILGEMGCRVDKGDHSRFVQ